MGGFRRGLATASALGLSALRIPRLFGLGAQVLAPWALYVGDRRAVHLTIDDGPDPASMPLILDALRRLEIPATFFVLGSRALGQADLLRRAVSEGHEIGVHFWEDRMTAALSASAVDDDLTRTMAALPPGIPVRFARPGYGLPSRSIVRALRARGLRLVVGDTLPLDTLPVPDRWLRALTLWGARPGSLLTFHDGAGRGQATVGHLTEVVPILKARGVRFAPLP